MAHIRDNENTDILDTNEKENYTHKKHNLIKDSLVSKTEIEASNCSCFILSFGAVY